MDVQQWTDLARTLGVAGPLVLLLAWLLREATAERKHITDRFLEALQNAIAASNESRATLVRVWEQHQERSTEEHSRMVNALNDLHERWNDRKPL